MAWQYCFGRLYGYYAAENQSIYVGTSVFAAGAGSAFARRNHAPEYPYLLCGSYWLWLFVQSSYGDFRYVAVRAFSP